MQLVRADLINQVLVDGLGICEVLALHWEDFNHLFVSNLTLGRLHLCLCSELLATIVKQEWVAFESNYPEWVEVIHRSFSERSLFFGLL